MTFRTNMSLPVETMDRAWWSTWVMVACKQMLTSKQSRGYCAARCAVAHLLASSNMVSVAMQDSSSAPKAMLACGIAGFKIEVCLARDVIRLSRTCTIKLRSTTVLHQLAKSKAACSA